MQSTSGFLCLLICLIHSFSTVLLVVFCVKGCSTKCFRQTVKGFYNHNLKFLWPRNSDFSSGRQSKRFYRFIHPSLPHQQVGMFFFYRVQLPKQEVSRYLLCRILSSALRPFKKVCQARGCVPLCHRGAVFSFRDISVLHSIHFASDSLQLLSCKMITSHGGRAEPVMLLLMWASWREEGRRGLGERRTTAQ